VNIQGPQMPGVYVPQPQLPSIPQPQIPGVYVQTPQMPYIPTPQLSVPTPQMTLSAGGGSAAAAAPQGAAAASGAPGVPTWIPYTIIGLVSFLLGMLVMYLLKK
jgi:hypothetical protein